MAIVQFGEFQVDSERVYNMNVSVQTKDETSIKSSIRAKALLCHKEIDIWFTDGELSYSMFPTITRYPIDNNELKDFLKSNAK